MLRKNGLFLFIVVFAFSITACGLFQDSIGASTYFVGVWEDPFGGEGTFTFRADGTWTRVSDVWGNLNGTFSATGDASKGILVLESSFPSLFTGVHEYEFEPGGRVVGISWNTILLGLLGVSILVLNY